MFPVFNPIVCPKHRIRDIFHSHFIFTYLGMVAQSVHENCFANGRGKAFTNKKIDTTK